MDAALCVGRACNARVIGCGSCDTLSKLDRSIADTASGRTLARALASIGVARLEGMKLPVQIWYMSDELKPEDLDRLEELDIEPKDILVEQRRFEEFKDFHVSHSYGRWKFCMKCMLLLSLGNSIVFVKVPRETTT